MEVLDKSLFKNCLKAILASWSESETEKEFREKLKRIEKRYGKENTKKVAEALLTVLKERNSKEK